MRTCWEIREALSSGQANGSGNGWRISCAECPVRFSSRPCWEQCNGSSCCCAPIHITCDFCELYIQHRREISELTDRGALVIQAGAHSPGSHLSGGIPVMEQESAPYERVQFNVPNLWADHHTLRVREALSRLAGVQEMTVSSAFRMVAVSYDPDLTGPDAIASELAEAGYPVAVDGSGLATQPVPVQDGHKDPAWDRLGFRRAQTDPLDAKTAR